MIEFEFFKITLFGLIYILYYVATQRNIHSTPSKKNRYCESLNMFNIINHFIDDLAVHVPIVLTRIKLTMQERRLLESEPRKVVS